MAHATAWAADATGTHPHGSGRCPSKTEVLTGVDSPAASVPGLVVADSSVSSQGLSRVCPCVPLSSSCKAPRQAGRGPAYGPCFNSLPSLKVLSPHAGTQVLRFNKRSWGAQLRPQEARDRPGSDPGCLRLHCLPHLPRETKRVPEFSVISVLFSTF